MKEVFTIIFPGMMYFWVFFIGQTPMQEVLDERQTRTLQRMLAAPVSLSQFLLSKMIRCFLLCGLIQALLILLSTILFGIHWGNLFVLGLVIATGTLAVTGVLALIYSLARTREQANALSSAMLLAFALIGGSMFPFENLPHFLQAVGWISPNRWGVLALSGVIQAKPFHDLLKPVSILAGIGVLGSLIAFLVFRRNLLQSKT